MDDIVIMNPAMKPEKMNNTELIRSERLMRNEVVRLNSKIKEYESESFTLKKHMEELSKKVNELEELRQTHEELLENSAYTVVKLEGQIQDQVYASALELKLTESRELLETKDREIQVLQERERIRNDRREKMEDLDLKFWKYYDKNKGDEEKQVHSRYYTSRQYWRNSQFIEDQEHAIDTYKSVIEDLRKELKEKEKRIKELEEDSDDDSDSDWTVQIPHYTDVIGYMDDCKD